MHLRLSVFFNLIASLLLKSLSQWSPSNIHERIDEPQSLSAVVDQRKIRSFGDNIYNFLYFLKATSALFPDACLSAKTHLSSIFHSNYGITYRVFSHNEVDALSSFLESS